MVTMTHPDMVQVPAEAFALDAIAFPFGSQYTIDRVHFSEAGGDVIARATDGATFVEARWKDAEQDYVCYPVASDPPERKFPNADKVFDFERADTTVYIDAKKLARLASVLLSICEETGGDIVPVKLSFRKDGECLFVEQELGGLTMRAAIMAISRENEKARI